jgi:hypothetical protein
MENTGEVAEKDSEAYTLLQTLQAKHSPGSNTFYLRRNDYTEKRFLDLDLEKLRLLENEGILKMSEYVRQGTVDPNVMQLDLLPKGQEVLKSRTTVTRTETTIQETFEPVEEPAWKANKRFRDFVRTERGNAITTASPAALESTVRGHIQAIRSGTIPRKDMKSHQMWLMYCLLWRWDEIPEQLRHEAEDCRDLPLITRRSRSK